MRQDNGKEGRGEKGIKESEGQVKKEDKKDKRKMARREKEQSRKKRYKYGNKKRFEPGRVTDIGKKNRKSRLHITTEKQFNRKGQERERDNKNSRIGRRVQAIQPIYKHHNTRICVPCGEKPNDKHCEKRKREKENNKRRTRRGKRGKKSRPVLLPKRAPIPKREYAHEGRGGEKNASETDIGTRPRREEDEKQKEDEKKGVGEMTGHGELKVES